MNINEILDDIKSKLTGDPQKDGPFLKSQSEKYSSEEDYEQLNRELARLLFEVCRDDFFGQQASYLRQENQEVAGKLETVKKKYEIRNYNAGIEILEEIIKDNALAWNDTDDVTYKSFGTPLEHAVYLQVCNPEKEVRPVNCALSDVYSLYGFGLSKKERYDEAKKAFQRALELNPVDTDIILNYQEFLKRIGSYDEFRELCDMALRCAVNKNQLGRAYFNYAFYFVEKGELDSASMMLEMSHIFRDDDILDHDKELDYISKAIGEKPKMHSAGELSAFLESEEIQPGPSVIVVQSAYQLAQKAERELNYHLAKYFYETVLELTESDDVRDTLEDITKMIKHLEEEKD